MVNGSPSAVALVVLYVRQTRMIRAILTLASASEDVDEDELDERMRIVR